MLNLVIEGDKHPINYQIARSRSGALVRIGNRLSVEAEGRGDEELGRITFGPGGVKLEAIQTLHIRPSFSPFSSASPDTHESRGGLYRLEPIIDGRCEVMFLRHGDVITSPGINGGVSCEWRETEVQVNSSAAQVAQGEPSKTEDGIDETPEDDTEDEATLDDTVTEVPVTQPVTQPTKSQLSATPHLHTERSTVIHETPTANRIADQDNFNIVFSNEDRHVEATPTPEGMIAATETFSTARTDQSANTAAQNLAKPGPSSNRKRLQASPQVRVDGSRSRKRQSPNAVSPAATDEPPAKRTKPPTVIEEGKDDITQASPLDNINADPGRLTYSNKAKRRGAVISEATPTKSSRSSQRSATATTVTAYDGDAPRVVTSNSGIKEDGPTVKFLRKHGGALVKSVEDKCNVLCVRDGGLSRTMKVIQAIALGVPIVTDKWLTESAKAEGFLDLASFKPSVARQEKEWKFDLEKVWGVPQTPFKGYAIYFTPALKKTYINFREMERACQTVGAKVVSKWNSKNDKIIVLATEVGDPEAEKLIEDGEPCYHKDLLTTSILRGNLDLDSDEFKIKTKNAGVRRKGQRKST